MKTYYVTLHGETADDIDVFSLYETREEALAAIHEFAAAPHDGMYCYDRRDEFYAIAEVVNISPVFVRGLKGLKYPFGFNGGAE